MTYTPSLVSRGDQDEFTRWLDDELARIAQALNAVDNLALNPLAAEPARYKEGDVIYADGATYDPGFGAGPYYRSGATWIKMADTGGGAGVTSFNTRVGSVVSLVGDYSAFYAPLVHTHVEADITDLQAYLTDAPSDGNDYGRRDGAWEVVPGGSVSITAPYRFQVSTVEADPGSGNFRMDNATPASVTEIFLSTTTNDGNDFENMVGFLQAGDRVYIQQDNDAAKFILLDVTANVDNTGWYSIAGTVAASGTLFDSNGKCHVLFLFGSTPTTGFVSLTEDIVTLNGDLLTVDVSQGNNSVGLLRFTNLTTGAGAGTRVLDIGGVGSASTLWEIYRSTDQTGSAWWAHIDDHILSSGNHRLYWRNDSGQRFLEFDRSGEIRIGGGESFEKMFVDINADVVAVRNDATLYIEELAAANPEVSAHGQFWVRNDAPNTPMFTDDTGVDHELNLGGGATLPASTTEFAMLRADSGAGWIEETNILFNEQVSSIIPGALTGNILEIIDNVSGRAGLKLTVPGIEDMLLYVDDATFQGHINTQNLIVSAPSGTHFLHPLRAAYLTNNDNLSLEDSVAGKRISTATLGGDLEILAGNGSNNLLLAFGTMLSIVEAAAPNADVLTRGQIWVDSADNLPYYRNEVGTDFAMTGGAAGDLVSAGVPGGQIWNGGTLAGEDAIIRGSASSPDTGIIRIESPLELEYDTFANTTPAQQFAMTWAPSPTISSNYVGGCLSTSGVFDVTTAVFIPAIFSDTNRYDIGAAPGFSAITFINELSVVANNGNFNLPSALVMNVGLTHERNTSGTSTTAGATGMNFSPQTRTTVSGAVLTKTTQTAVRIAPTYSTVAGSTVNLGTIVGLDIGAPAAGLFQPGAGTENMTAYYGMRIPNITFGGGARTIAAINSQLVAATNVRVIDHTGSAPSRHRGNFFHDADNVGTFYGASNDVANYWNSADSKYRIQFLANAMSLRVESPGADRILIDTSSSNGEINIDADRFSFGQAGAVGNQVGVFVANTRTVSVGGEWTDFLLTQAGNITVDAAMSLVAGWTINAPSITLGTGSVTTGCGLNIGGNPNQGTNRVGVRILSNPSGGGGVNAALWVTAGLTKLDGDLDHSGTNLGFYGTAPIAKQLAVPVNAAAIHAALVALGLIT